MLPRTQGRELALKYLYQLDLLGDRVQPLDDFIARYGAGARPDDYARTLVGGVRAHLADLDQAISRVAAHWEIGRMAVVDRNVLRLGAWEILYAPDVPARVAINEALELVKRFSGADSGAFVNGLLDQIKSICDRLLEEKGQPH